MIEYNDEDQQLHNTWPQKIRWKIYLLTVIVIALSMISILFTFWSNSQKHNLLSLSDNYHSATISYYLSAIDELHQVEIDIHRTLLEWQTEDTSGFRQDEESNQDFHADVSPSSLFSLIDQYIGSGVLLEKQYKDENISVLVKSLEKKSEKFQAGYYNYKKIYNIDSDLDFQILGLVNSLKQLVDLHSISRDETLAQLELLDENHNKLFTMMVILFIVMTLILVKRTTSEINLIVNENESSFSHIISKLAASKKQTENINSNLEDKNTELERFTYTVSHDLKSPLVTVKGFIGLLERDIKDEEPERVAKDLLQISTAADKMALLLDDLLELSRVGRVVNKPQIIPLTELFNETLLLVQGQAEAAGAKITIQDNMPEIIADKHRLLEVTQNLLDNAIKFKRKNVSPLIEVSASVEGKRVVCCVKDNGIGIEKNYHDKIFGLFDRLDLSYDGTGIGLALVKRIIEIHDGDIKVYNSKGSAGANFCFSLPTCDKATGYKE